MEEEPPCFQPPEGLPPLKRRTKHKGNTSGEPLGVVGGGKGLKHSTQQPDEQPDEQQASGMAHDDDAQHAPPWPPPQPAASQQQQRQHEKVRMDNRWRETMPAMREDVQRLSPLHADWHKQECNERRTTLQRRVDECFMHHTARCGCQDTVDTVPEVVDRYTAVYLGLGCSFNLSIPRWKCPCCWRKFQPQPAHVRCLGNTPTSHTVWVDLLALKQYSTLFRYGTSGTAFTESLNCSSCCFDMDGAPVVDAESFQSAFVAHRRVTFKLHSLENLGVSVDSSPLNVCPICSPREGGECYQPSIAIDGVTKANHMAHAGSDVKLEPHIHHFMDKGEQERCERGKTGCMDSLQAFKQHHSDNGDALEEARPRCTSHLHCARPGSKDVTHICDVCGVVGGCCCHGFAIPNLFCNMDRPENFTFYLVLLKHLTQACPTVKIVYIDFGCRMATAWAWYKAVLGEDLPSTAHHVLLMVNWMHAASHDMPCQLRNNARFQPGTGRVVGEQAEQLWSMIKDPSSILRCMTLQNRHDCLEALLADLNALKLERLVPLLKRQTKQLLNKTQEFASRIAQIETEAHNSGIHDLIAASQDFKKQLESVSDAPSRTPQHDAAEYVRLREIAIGKQKLQGAGLSPRNANRDSAAGILLRSCSRKEQDLLDIKLADWERHLEIQPWPLDSPQYSAGFKFLAELWIISYQEQIDLIVHKLAQLHMDKSRQGEASKETAALGKAISKEHAKLRGRLEEMHVWMAAASDDPQGRVQVLPQGVVEGMLRGEPAPWHVGGVSSGVRLVLGRRYFVAANDQARCVEQLSVLPLEKRRLIQWLQMVLAKISGRLRSLEVQCSQLCAPWHLALEHGAVFWLKWHERKLSAMMREVSAPW